MDTKTPDKKWFIYVGDHHEGPFTVHEIAAGIIEGRFQKTAFVWAQGMADWQPMSQVDEFNPKPPMASAPPAPEPVAPAPVAPAPQPEPQPEPQPQSQLQPTLTDNQNTQPTITQAIAPSQPQPEKTLTTVVEVRDLRAAEAAGAASSPAPVAASATSPGLVYGSPTPGPAAEQSTQPKMVSKPAGLAPAGKKSVEEDFARDPSSGRLKKVVLLLLILGGGLFGLHKAGLLAGVEGRIVSALSSIPALPDVDPADYEALKAAVKTPISEAPAVNIAVSKEDPLSPIFYVATNLSDGAKFELFIEGIPHTLLNTFTYSGKLEVTTQKGLGKSAPLRYPDGKVIPRGEYNVYIMEAADGQPEKVTAELANLTPIARNLPAHLPKERRLSFTKVLFLGQKDASYLTRLKEFHDKVAQKVQQEIQDLRQMLNLLDSQYQATTVNFDRLKKQRIGPAQVRAWNTMNGTWKQIDHQLSDSFAKLTPEMLAADYYHGNLYSRTQEVWKLLNVVHSAEEELFTKRLPIQTVDPKVLDARLTYENAMKELKGAIEGIEKSPLDSNGIPRKAVLAGGQANGSS